jgi:hypothetical protein
MWNEIKEQKENTTLHILNISQNMFICLEFILLIAARGFISVFDVDMQTGIYMLQG